jgi:hypothetical protein
MRQILPGKVSDQDAATILGVLNTNSHELGEWGGSGLYMKALLMEHDCRPNCSFTTHGSWWTQAPLLYYAWFVVGLPCIQGMLV